MSKIHLGIDPGKNGCLAVNIEGNITFFPFPSIGKEIDVHGIVFIIESVFSTNKGNEIFAVMEDVHAMYGSAAEATFQFGRAVGIIEAILYSYKIPFEKVQPKKWQSLMWQGIPIQKKDSSTGKTQVNNTKLMSEMAVKRIFPSYSFKRTERSKKNDDNIIDAVLISEYCRRVHS